MALSSGWGARAPSGVIGLTPYPLDLDGGCMGVCVSKLHQALHLGLVNSAACKLYPNKNNNRRAAFIKNF